MDGGASGRWLDEMAGLAATLAVSLSYNQQDARVDALGKTPALKRNSNSCEWACESFALYGKQGVRYQAAPGHAPWDWPQLR